MLCAPGATSASTQNAIKRGNGVPRIMVAKRVTLTVADVFKLDESQATIVAPATPFAEVVQRFTDRRELRGIFVVDGRTLVGVITRVDLLHWVAEKLGVRNLEGDDWRDVYRIMSASTAEDACRPRSEHCTVQPEDPLSDALAMMMENELIDIPVVDGEGQILGDLRLTELFSKVLEVHS